MTTARDLIKSMYRKISVLGQGVELTAEEANDGLSCINDMLASWSTDGALIYTETKETFNLTGAQSYTIGSGADFDTVVPVDIKAAYVSYSGTDYPLQIIGRRDYARISDKDLQGTASKLYFDSNFPTANIYLWPVGNADTITLFTEKPLTEFTDLDTVYAMPPEYRRAIIHNGAVEGAPEFDTEASMTVKNIATKSLNNVKSQNRKNNTSKIAVDSAFMMNNRGSYDINSGGYL